MGAEESGGFGFGMHLPERDGVYADLLLLDLFMRERAAGRWPVSHAIEHFHELAGPSCYRRIDVHVDRADYPDVKRRLLVDLREQAPTELAGRAGRPDAAARHRTTASSSGSPTGRGCSSARPGTEPLVRVYTEATSEATAGGAARRRRATGARPMSARRRRDAAGRREAVGARADLGPHRSLRRQGHRHRGRQAAVAPAARGQGRIDPRHRRPPAPDPGGRDGRGPGRGARGRRASPRADRPDPSLRGDRADRAGRGLDPRARRRRPARGRLRARGYERPVGREIGRFHGCPRARRRVYPLDRRDRHHRSRCMTGRRPRERPNWATEVAPRCTAL